jgi:hypothetical protein
MSLRIIGGIMRPLVRASTIKVTDPLKIRQDFERTARVFLPIAFRLLYRHMVYVG